MSPLIVGKSTGNNFLIIVMGVSGTGKSTLGSALARSLNVPFIDGDDLHPPNNVAKMSRGEALNDADREPWLARIHATAAKATSGGIVIACSALKRYYRDILRGNIKLPDDVDAPRPTTWFVHIDGTREVILKRMEARAGHFMKAGMLDGQLATLENPVGEENVVVVPLEATTEEQVQMARDGLKV